MNKLSLALIAIAAMFASIGLPAYATPGQDDPPAQQETMPATTDPYALNVEREAKDWGMCVFLDDAKDLVEKYEHSAELGDKALADYRAAKKCGIFSSMQVELKEKLYSSPPGATQHGAIFGGLLKVGNGWGQVFLIDDSAFTGRGQ